jgi:16S rRNA (guanine527-N7)-methyltransferase
MIDIFQKGLKKLNIEIDDRAMENLILYLQELNKWNQKMNLIAKAPVSDVVEAHFIDSLTILPMLDFPGAKLMDVGTGAGFPGLVLKSASPNLSVTLVEPRQKRLSFLSHITRKLYLDNVNIWPCRLTSPQNMEADKGANRFSVITSRAVCDLDSFLKLAVPWCEPEGKIICMKGPRGADELKQWQKKTATDMKQLKLENISEFQLPFSGARRYLISFRLSL